VCRLLRLFAVRWRCAAPHLPLCCSQVAMCCFFHIFLYAAVRWRCAASFTSSSMLQQQTVSKRRHTAREQIYHTEAHSLAFLITPTQAKPSSLCKRLQSCAHMHRIHTNPCMHTYGPLHTDSKHAHTSADKHTHVHIPQQTNTPRPASLCKDLQHAWHPAPCTSAGQDNTQACTRARLNTHKHMNTQA